jgi:hypothetical protein
LENFAMTVSKARRVLAGTLALLFWTAAASPSVADIKDYEFQLVQTETKIGDTTVTVRLVDKRSGKTVPDAVIFAQRIDMAPDAMPTMAAAIEQLPSTAPGIYRFKTNLVMAGRWQLSLGAKIQGENDTLESKLVVTARP